MLVLADETLESFFDYSLANSFHLADAPLPSSTVTTSNLLSHQQTNLSVPKDVSIPAISPGGAGAGVVPPGKGLRGMLDNIVTDGMRVAAEVRKRMDEAQKELDKGAVTRGTEDDDDDEGDHDLLDLQEADAGGGGQKVEHGDPSILDPSLIEQVKGKGNAKGKGKEKVVDDAMSADTMFER